MPRFGGRLDFPPEDFNDLIDYVGTQLSWRRSHLCACVASNGSPDINCKTCKGLGRYWDNAAGPFRLGFAFTGAGNVNLREPGVQTDPMYGGVIFAEPLLSIPYTSTTATMWQFAGEYDIFTQVDAMMSLEVTVRNASDGTRYLPYINGAIVDRVTVYDRVNAQIAVVAPSDYSVTAGKVTLSNKYAPNEPFNVSYRFNPTYVAFDTPGGLPHIRAVLAGETAPPAYPRRFRLKALDQWLRESRSP